MPHLSADTAVLLFAICAGAGIVWSDLEILRATPSLLDGFFTWPRERPLAARRLGSKPVAALDSVLASPHFPKLIAAHAMSAVAFPISFALCKDLAAVFAALLILGQALIMLRLISGMNFADTMQLTLWPGVFVYCLDLGAIVHSAALCFIAAQVLAAYFFGGINKLRGPLWRRGRAVGLILRTQTFSVPWATHIAQARGVSEILSWGTIGFEVLGPALLLLGARGAALFALLGVCFHLAIALIMGFPTFFFVFVASYPVLYHLAQRFVG